MGPLTDTPTPHVSHHASFSALHHAALGGSLELIALLLEAQATVDIKDSNGETPGSPLAGPAVGAGSRRSVAKLMHVGTSLWAGPASPLQSPSRGAGRWVVLATQNPGEGVR